MFFLFVLPLIILSFLTGPRPWHPISRTPESDHLEPDSEALDTERTRDGEVPSSKFTRAGNLEKSSGGIPSRELTYPPKITKNGILKMIFLFLRWDMLIPWRVVFLYFFGLLEKTFGIFLLMSFFLSLDVCCIWLIVDGWFMGGFLL